MWDLQKMINHAAGVRRREAKGLPPLHSTPDEREKMDRFVKGCEEARAKRND